MSFEKKILSVVTVGAIAATSLTGYKANAKRFESPDERSIQEENYKNRKIGPSYFEHLGEIAQDVYMKLSEIINSKMLEYADAKIFQDTPEYRKMIESSDKEILMTLIEQLSKGDTKYMANKEYIFKAAKEFYSTISQINTIFESSGGDEAFFRFLFSKIRDFDKAIVEGIKELEELNLLTNKLVRFFPKKIFVGGLPVSNFGHFEGRTVDPTILRILANFTFIKKKQKLGTTTINRG